MALSLPQGQGIAQPVGIKNFMAFQSCSYDVTTTSSNARKTFTIPVQAQNVQYHITNTGSAGAFIAAGLTGSTPTAAATTGTPAPAASGNGTFISAGLYIAPGTVQVVEFPAGYYVIAAVTGASTTTLQISIGYGS